ncbi:MAG: hypothetical protein ACREB3_13140, partial [Burkholderiales bacterium]
ALIEEFQRHSCIILEADTDGIYLSTERYHAEPEKLLALAAKIMPTGIELEYDGSYDAMFCYKAKNYALASGGRITLRGSALRSRGIEPFLKRLGDQLIAHLLGVSAVSPLALLPELRTRIASGELPVAELAKTETLSQNPDAYAQWVAGGGKPRRAALEVALQMQPRPRMGERVTYYIGPRTKGLTNDWQRAHPIGRFDARQAPYDSQHYLAKIDDWLDRYGRFLGHVAQASQQEMPL